MPPARRGISLALGAFGRRRDPLPAASVVDRSECVRPAASHFSVILNGVKDPVPCVRSQPPGRNGFFAAAQNDRSGEPTRMTGSLRSTTQCSDQRDVSCTVVRQAPPLVVIPSRSEESPLAGCIQTQERSFGCGLRMTRCGEAVSCIVVRQAPPLVVIPSRSEASGQRMTRDREAANLTLHAGRSTQCSDQRDVSCTVVRQPPRPFVMLSLSEASPHAGCIQTQERSFGCAGALWAEDDKVRGGCQPDTSC